MSRSNRFNLTPAERAERKSARTAKLAKRVRRTSTRQAYVAAAIAERI